MIRHVVMFKFLPEADGHSALENALRVKDILDALPGKINLIRASYTVINSKEASSTNCELMLCSDFDSFEDLETYRVHPDHVAVGVFMRPLREYRTCVDYEI